MVSTSEGFCEDPVTTEDTVWDYYCEVRQSQICLDPTSSAWDCQSKEGSGAGISFHVKSIKHNQGNEAAGTSLCWIDFT